MRPALAYLLYGVVIVIYRLFFHTLARFPGPKIAAATAWYETYHDLKPPGGQFMKKINELHDIYGPIVRISPEEVHIRDSKFVEVLFAGPGQGKRDKHVAGAHAAGTPQGVFGTQAHDVHRRRRAALNPLFSKTGAAAAESMIYDKADLLVRRVDEQIIRDGFSDLRKVFAALAVDVVSEYISGRSAGLLEDEAKTTQWHDSIRVLAFTIPVVRQFNWIMPLSMALPRWLMNRLAPEMALATGVHDEREAEARMAIQLHAQDAPTQKSSDYRAAPLHHLAVYRTLLSNDVLPPSEKEYNRMSHEAVTILAAGGETTTSALTAAVYFVYSDKETILPKLLAELGSIINDENPRPPIAKLEKLPYLTAVIKETLRITTLTGRLTRVAPEDTLTYGKWSIPAGTAIGMNLRDVSLDPEIFPEPTKFDPERWLPGNPNLDLCNRYYMPFSRGTRSCVGLNVAYAELYIVLATLFRAVDFDLHDTVRERDVDFVRDFFVGETSADSRGVRVKYGSSRTV
ncbi:putative flavonoid 3-hydroxylase [Hypoxylon argillaceum]|nr:putative flavonoid 3-hydroxylase [Hypoxylon argillaceum]